jgi:hypothetical protein
MAYNTKEITIRKVFAYNPNDSLIPALTTLTSDGAGGTYWATPAALGGSPAFNQIIANNVNIPATLAFESLRLNSGEGLGMVQNATTKEVSYFSKCFSQFDVIGGNSLKGYSNSVITPTVKFQGLNGISITGDPTTNTMYFENGGPVISTGVYAYNKMNVISNAPIVSEGAIDSSNNTVLTATSPSTVMNIIGVGDIKLSANYARNALYITISTFTSAGYLDISGVAYGTYSSCMSTTSSLFYDAPKIGQTTSSIVNMISNVSTGIQSKIGFDNNNLMTNYTLLSYSRYVSTATNSNLISLSNATTLLDSGLYSTISYTSTLKFPIIGTTLTGNVTGTTYELSTVSFNLQSMSNMINTESLIHLIYSPSLIFNSNTNPTNIFTISTFVKAGNTILSDVFVRPWLAPATASSNIYSDTMLIDMNNQQVRNSYTSTYTILHNITSFTSIQSCNLIYASSDNSLKVSLSGQKFLGI